MPVAGSSATPTTEPKGMSAPAMASSRASDSPTNRDERTTPPATDPPPAPTTPRRPLHLTILPCASPIFVRASVRAEWPRLEAARIAQIALDQRSVVSDRLIGRDQA